MLCIGGDDLSQKNVTKGQKEKNCRGKNYEDKKNREASRKTENSVAEPDMIVIISTLVS
jgi:hypothetical protein